MKFNWGTGIAIVIGAFMVFILQYVVRVQIDDRYDNELVTENYYQQEIEVDGKYDREKNSQILMNPVKIETSGKDILISFPKEFDYKKITGTIFLYRPSSQKLDFELPISLSSSSLLIPNAELVDGRWDITVEWYHDGTPFRSTGKLTL